jgi:hypothetical protein
MKRSTNARTNIYISRDVYRIHEESSTMHSPYLSPDIISTENNDSNTSTEFQK